VATRDAHVPPPRRRDDSQSGGRRYVVRTAVCWAGDGAHRHPRDVAGWLPCSVRERSVVWTSLGPLPRWVPGPTTRWAPRTTRLTLHGTWRRGAQGLHRSSTRLRSCTCSALYRGLLDVLD
jgi:hypothetical protein